MRSSRRRFHNNEIYLCSQFFLYIFLSFGTVGAGHPEQEPQPTVDVHNRGSHQSTGSYIYALMVQEFFSLNEKGCI